AASVGPARVAGRVVGGAARGVSREGRASGAVAQGAESVAGQPSRRERVDAFVGSRDAASESGMSLAGDRDRRDPVEARIRGGVVVESARLYEDRSRGLILELELAGGAWRPWVRRGE